MEKYDVIIIGGGVSGIFCAKELSKNSHLKVCIVEKMDRLGKKMSASGNGKCNFTNSFVDPSKYNHPSFVSNLLDKYSFSYITNYFKELGVLSKEISEGRVYPYTESAKDLVNYLVNDLLNNGVTIKTSFTVTNVAAHNSLFQVSSEYDTITSKYLVFSTGGCSARILGSDGSGYKLLKKHGINITSIRPGLVGYKVVENISLLQGLRMKARLKLARRNNQIIFERDGEVQFKKDGISGIVVMESSLKYEKDATSYIYLDFFKDYSKEDLITYFNNVSNPLNLKELTGSIPSTLIKYIKSNYKVNSTLELVDLLKNFKLSIKTTYGFDDSQVTVGGVDINEVSEFELNKLPNAFVCGELLDINGDCGGYNIHFAISSGLFVGSKIYAKTIKH